MDEALGDAVAEVLQIRILAGINQGQDSERVDGLAEAASSRRAAGRETCRAAAGPAGDVAQRRSQRLRRLTAPRDAFLQAGADQRLQVERGAHAADGQAGRFFSEDCRLRLRRRLARERPAAAYHLVEHATQRENIAARVHFLSTHLFRGHVSHRAQHGAGVRLRRNVRSSLGGTIRSRRDPGQAEIKDLHAAVASQKEILRFEVPVDDSLGVGGGESLRDRRGDHDRVPPRQRAPGQPAAERLAFEQLHDRIRDGSVRAIIMDGEDVRMRQSCYCLGFALEAGQPVRVMGEGFRQDLDGNLALQARIPSAVHLSHPAGAEGRDNRVRSKPARDHKHARRPPQAANKRSLSNSAAERLASSCRRALRFTGQIVSRVEGRERGRGPRAPIRIRRTEPNERQTRSLMPEAVEDQVG